MAGAPAAVNNVDFCWLDFSSKPSPWQQIHHLEFVNHFVLLFTRTVNKESTNRDNKQSRPIKEDGGLKSILSQAQCEASQFWRRRI